MADKISLEGLDKAAVFAALYNGTRAQGLGFLNYSSSSMTPEEAKTRFGPEFGYFDYVDGRVMKVNLAEKELDPWLYDRDNGQGAAERVINSLRGSGQVNNEEITGLHQEGLKKAAEELAPFTSDTDESYIVNGTAVTKLGFDQFKDDLDPILRQILKKK